ncbi:UNVERIFIED_CONTAM: hypothetical protein HDU68_006577 [Siphonaria sp. JEL0065]|nr:hypothetical protein HDU68_006577 [Siphonaria sp. JEL0065]
MEDEAKYVSERLGLCVRDIDESFPAQPAGSWFMLFKNQLRFTEPVYLAASLYVPDSLQTSACLRMFDNDTGKELPHIFHNLKSSLFKPNTDGFTILADCRTATARPAGKWKLRLISDPIPIYPPDKPPTEVSIKPITQDFEDSYIPNKHNILFRFVLKVKDAPENVASMQLSFSLPQAMLKLQVFDNDIEIASASGKGIVSLHTVSLQQVIEDTPAAVIATGGKVDKKEKEAAEKKEKEEKERIAAAAAAAAASGEKTPLKHRYVLQATVQQLELLKPNSAGLLGAGLDAANRVASARAGGKAPSSASPAKSKKKQSAGGPTFTTDPASATSPSVPAVAEASWSWKLRIISTDTASLIVVKDTEKEDRYKMIKDSWEANQQGRSARAREARDQYLKLVESGSIKPVAIMLTPLQDDLPAVVQIGKPKEVVITATGSDIVYKPWVILKENGQGSRRLDSMDKQVSVFGTNGEKIVYDTSKLVSTASTDATTATGTGRTISLFEEVNLDGLKPITASSSEGLKERGSSANSKKAGALTVGASVSSTQPPTTPIIEGTFEPPIIPTISTVNEETFNDISNQAATLSAAATLSKPSSVSFETQKPAQIPQFQATVDNASEQDDGLGECPTTINDLQAYLKGKSTYTRRATLFSMGAQMVGGHKPPLPGDAFEFKLPTVMLPGGFKKQLDIRNSTAQANTSGYIRRTSKPPEAGGRSTVRKSANGRTSAISSSSTKDSNSLESVAAGVVGGNGNESNHVSVTVAVVRESASELDELEYMFDEGRPSLFPVSRKQSFQNAWKPPPPSKLIGRVMNDADREERAQKRQERLQEHIQFHEEVLRMRLSDREYRYRVKQYVTEKMEEILMDIDAEKGEDQIRREMYRARVAKEYEDASKLKLQQEMQRAAELAALEGAAEEQAKDAAAANKKKGKK